MSRCKALNICYDRYLIGESPAQGGPVGAARIALVNDKMWEPGDAITVSFIGGSSTQRQHVVDVANRYMQIVNLKFQFVDGTGGMWRIAFNPSLGAWAMIGKDALGVPRGQPTMNLGFDQPGTYTHEFGHGVGAIHEHQTPFGNPIKWNVPQVEHDLGGPPNNWDSDTIQHNMFEHYAATLMNGTQFDKFSVMLYAMPATWTLDGFHVEPNAVLSAEDIRWLTAKYPGRKDPPPPPPPTTIPFTLDGIKQVDRTVLGAVAKVNPANVTSLCTQYQNRIEQARALAFAGHDVEGIVDELEREMSMVLSL